MLTYSILTNPGEREYNEDYAGAARNGDAYCFVLADGLGGHGGGDEASRLVSEYIMTEFRKNGKVTEEYLKRCFEESQRLLLQEQKRQNRVLEMKTTLVVLLADEGFLQWGHIGDSRLYFYRKGKFIGRTLDHSVPQMLAAAGEIQEKQIRGHSDRNRLLRVMGTEWDGAEYNLSESVKRTGQEAFLLCSDGFWEWVEDKEMRAALRKAKSPAEWAMLMERKVQKNGMGKGMDNYSAITVFLD